jgi:glycosyltransferase involved in cell wall biosynthesis
MVAVRQMSAAPLVSVILPTFNRLSYLKPALLSVFGQSLTDWELIIADDGSDAPTRAYLRSVESPPRVRVIWLPHTGNYSAVRNAALREARGEYVAFLDSDDLWRPDKLELQIEALRANAARRWNYTGHRCIDGAGNEIKLPGVAEWVPYAGAISREVLRGQALVCTPSVLASRELVERAGCFDEQQNLFEDVDLWLRLLTLSEVSVVDEPLVSVRKHEQNTCGTGADMLAARARMLLKMRALVRDDDLRRMIEELRALNAVCLAAVYADTDRVTALRALCSSSRHSWSHADWWLRASRVLLKVILPRRVVAIYRANRVGRHRGAALGRS